MSFAMLPPATDFFALLGIALLLCAGFLRLLRLTPIGGKGCRYLLAVAFLLLWIPVGAAHIPLLAYVRGISSDLSVTLVALACVSLLRAFDYGWSMDNYEGETRAVFVSVAIAAVFLYPLALGWGNWDAYRPGWGSVGMLVCVLLTGLLGLAIGLRLLPLLLALALLTWTAGLMESGNLWDYLFDPWLAVASIFQVLKMGFVALRSRFKSRLRRGQTALAAKAAN